MHIATSKKNPPFHLVGATEHHHFYRSRAFIFTRFVLWSILGSLMPSFMESQNINIIKLIIECLTAVAPSRSMSLSQNHKTLAP